MTEPTEGIMSKVMKLLERANHPDTPPHEAALAEQLAEKIMAKHMIDRFEAEQLAKKRGETVRRPVQEEWEFHKGAYSKGNDDYEFEAQIESLMQTVLAHCNIRINRRGEYRKKVVGEDFGDVRYSVDYSTRVFKIVGFPEDIAYAERIWFNVFRTFVSNVNPTWDNSKSIEYNAYNFASAGVSWKQQVLLAEAAGDSRINWPWRYQGEDRNQPFYSSHMAGSPIDPGNDAWGKGIHQLKRACKKYSVEHEVAYPYAAGSKLRIASRNSFASSYRSTMEQRLVAMRTEAQKDTGVGKEQFALAIRDTAERVEEEFYRLFPEYDPEVQARKRKDEEWARAAIWASLSPEEQRKALREEAAEYDKWERRSARARRNFRSVRDSGRPYDEAAWDRGRSAANSVNLRDDAEVQKTQRKGIE